jgi:ankyrin repeat protein
MKLNKISIMLASIFISININATSIESGKTEVSKIEISKSSTLKDKNIQTILKQETFAKRYILLKGYLSQKKDLLIQIKDEKNTYNIPILSYLLIEGFEKEAIELVEQKVVESFQFFDFKGNEYNDILIAILNNQDEYFETVTTINKEKINKQFKFNNEEGYYILMAVAELKSLRSNMYTKKLLELGANPYLQTKNGHTAEKLAAYKNNNYFLETLNNFENKKEDKDSLKNSPLPYKEKIKQQKIIENLKSGLLIELSENIEDMTNKWITLIVLGYNEAAEILYSELIKNEKFNINNTNDKNINALMAASLSAIPGGNIEYTLKLIERDIDISYEYNDTRALHIAISRDAYKVVLQLIKKGDNFIKDKNGKYFFDMAMEKNSLKTAHIIKSAARIIVNNKE